jgi:general secretion pathway protein D
MFAAFARAQGVAPVGAPTSDSLHIRFAETDLRVALQAIGQYLDRPLALSAGIPASRITFETPRPVARNDLPRILKGLLDVQGLEMVADTLAGIYRVQPRTIPVQPPPRSAQPTRAASGPLELFTLRMKHVKAQEAAATISALYGRPSAVGELGSRVRSLDYDLKDNLVPSPGSPPGVAVPQTMSAPSPARSASFGGDVTIVPDTRSNSLLIRASRDDYQLIEAAARAIDVRPLQALIEAMVVEMRRDRSLAYGLDAALGKTPVTGLGTVSATQRGLGLGDFALSVMGVDGKRLDLTLSAAASRGDARIVSRPVVIAANNEEANILVGSQRPFVQVQRSLPTEAPARDQVVQYKDVGTRLIVKPTISDDNYVMLEVLQEVNAATAETQFDAPVISTRMVKTRLLVKDGQTVVLGGLTDRQRDNSSRGVPLLSAIPWIGGLFGSRGEHVNETELFIFLTPHVLRSDADADSVTNPKLKRSGVDP